MKSHPFRWDALVFGLLFAALSLATVLPIFNLYLDLLPRLQLLAPLALIGLGVLGLIISLGFAAGGRRNNDTSTATAPLSTRPAEPLQPQTVEISEPTTQESTNGNANE